MDSLDSLGKYFDMSKIKFDFENNILNALIARQADNMDAETYMQLQSIISAFNKRGVSTKTVFEAFMEAVGGGTNE